MKIYRVGGAVRDKYLDLPSTEQDWLVVGATAKELLMQGYRRVGKDFPVFLHPTTKEEYALARTERKSGRGYAGFIFDSSTTVTLEEDLARRDLTINAMAEDDKGALYDPYQGLDDLQKKILRHVSPAFIEDPVRILRTARFSARFAHLGFSIAAETENLMCAMVKAGEVDDLVAERVWQEWQRSLAEESPAMFLQVLKNCGALDVLFPEIATHYVQVLQNLVNACRLTTDPKIRFAILINALSINEIEKVCTRYRVPRDYQELALLAKKERHIINEPLTAEKILIFLESTDAFRRQPRWQELLFTLSILGLNEAQKITLEKAWTAAKGIDFTSLQQNLQGKEIGEKIHALRLAAIGVSVTL